MIVKEYIIKRQPNHGAYYITIIYEADIYGESTPTQYGPFSTLWGAKRQIKRWAKEEEDDEIIAKYDKNGKKIEPLSWTDFC